MITAPVFVTQAAPATGVDAFFERYFAPFAGAVESVVFYSVPLFGTQVPLIVSWIVICGLFFTFWLKFLAVRGMGHAFDLVRGKYTRGDEPGEVTHFQALATALASTVGLGNIAGVAIAITIGGPGATFWMIVAGVVGMSTKMAECTVAVKYRRIREDGTVSGGPMWYLSDGLADIGRARLGKVLAALWAICFMFAALGTNAFQSNQATTQIIAVSGGGLAQFFGSNRWLIGLVIALVTAAVIIGGVKSIARVTSVMVPFMGLVYVIGCLTVILVNVSAVPEAVRQIFVMAFTPEGVAGGAVGSLIVGFQRATFSNSAGVGDAPIAHSVVKTSRPATEGYVAALEPFFDTVIICTMTAVTIVVTGAWQNPQAAEIGGVAITSQAFSTVASWFPYVLALAVVLFAYSTILSNSFYGMKAFGYIFKDNRTAETIYKVVFCLFTVIGAAVSLGPVITFTDSIFFLSAFVNVIGLYFLAKVIRREFTNYRRGLETGEIPVITPEMRAEYAQRNR